MDCTVAVSVAASTITLPRSISAPPPAAACELDVDEHEVMRNGAAVTNTAPASIFILFFIGLSGYLVLVLQIERFYLAGGGDGGADLYRMATPMMTGPSSGLMWRS